MTPSVDESTDSSCPICLESLTPSESRCYPLPCQNCDFNYCSNCVESFCRAANDDFQVASDGSRQVKISVACPQCRSKYPLDDLESTVLLLRSAHALASSILTKVEEAHASETSSKPKYRLLGDSNLSATQLARKSEFSRNNFRQRLEDAAVLYEHAMAKGGNQKQTASSKAYRSQARDLWTALLDQLPAKSCRCDDSVERCDGSCGSRNSIEVVLQPSRLSRGNNDKDAEALSPSFNPRRDFVDETLFQGFHDFMNKDEQIFLTGLFTSGDTRGISQAALIMNGVRRMAMSNHLSPNISKSLSGEDLSKQELQKLIEIIDQTKLQFPLPNHMPGYFLIPPFSYREGYMTLKEKLWDGSITPPQRSKRVFESVYGKYYTPPQPPKDYPVSVATISAVKGPVGRLGLRKGDVVTHVNDAEWNGGADALMKYIYDCHQQRPGEEISLSVNCNVETCQFLKVRMELLQEQRRKTSNHKKSTKR